MSSKSTIEVRAGLQLPHLAEEHRLNPVLASALKKAVSVPNARKGPYWSPDFFDLNNSDTFSGADEKQKVEILRLCSDSLLHEAYFIEKSGMAYAAKMSLLSQTTEERMLYSMFASDEASHFELIRSFIGRPPENEAENPFLLLLSNLIENGDRDTLVFVIQIVLEGWGITHYRKIADGCDDQDLKTVFEAILRDEARHHGSGLVLFENKQLSVESKNQIVEVMTQFLCMVQMGPQSVVSAVESVLGPLEQSDKVRLFKELNAQGHSEKRLNELRQLMVKAKVAGVLEELDQKNMFVAFTAEECAA